MPNRPLLVIGGIALDITATIGKSLTSILHTSTPGRVKQSLGGVGRNVAEAAWRTGGSNVKLVSVVGDDLAGQSVKEAMKLVGMNIEYIETLKSQPTAVYNALHSHDGQLVAAVADMDIFDSMDSSKIISIIQKEKPNFVCFDGNLSSNVMKKIATTCHSLSIPAFFEPTSVSKSLKLFEHAETSLIQSIKFSSPNQFELEAMCDTIKSHPILSKKKPATAANQKDGTMLMQLKKEAPKLAQKVLPYALYMSDYIPNIITKLGEEGCLFVGGENHSVIKYFPPEFIDAHEIKSVTGAGDCFVGTLIANLQKHINNDYNNIDVPTQKLGAMIHKAQSSSIRTLKSNHAVSTEIGHDLLV